jgi:2-keto-4-pentenoate hydratase/2-oxohepta-3-ene-1,7-dioic acid hydratase in catechol pathway
MRSTADGETMRLVTVNNSSLGQSGAIIGEEVLNFAMIKVLDRPSAANWIPGSVKAILEGGPEGLAIVDRLVKTVEDADDGTKDRLREVRALSPYGETRFLAPIPRPGIVFSTGMSYRSHDEEMVRAGALAEIPPVRPFPPGFFKNTNAIIGDGQPIVLPRSAPGMVDWECEVSFVIGKTCHNVKPDEALDYVVGHTIMNDVSARDWVSEFVTTGNPATNLLGKQFRTFCPIGPCIATNDEIVDPHDIEFSLRLNGEAMQHENVANSYFRIGDIIAYYSQWLTFQPGDIISRGNPAGVGYARRPQIFLRDGDIVEMEAAGIGKMRLPVVAERPVSSL